MGLTHISFEQQVNAGDFQMAVMAAFSGRHGEGFKLTR
jgi:hypothetical protein